MLPRDDVICISSDSEEDNDHNVSITPDSVAINALKRPAQRVQQSSRPTGTAIPVYTGAFSDGPNAKRQRTVSYSTQDGYTASVSSSHPSSTPFSKATVEYIRSTLNFSAAWRISVHT